MCQLLVSPPPVGNSDACLPLGPCTPKAARGWIAVNNPRAARFKYCGHQVFFRVQRHNHHLQGASSPGQTVHSVIATSSKQVKPAQTVPRRLRKVQSKCFRCWCPTPTCLLSSRTSAVRLFRTRGSCHACANRSKMLEMNTIT